ncbi:Long-chain fatty acid transport protein 1 [Lamellibrachia satsuma]|nr:Long-chain fatty acid transport protein 1 [Lamellibrachia satsuma]
MKTNQTIPHLFEETVQRHPRKVAFQLVEGRQWTFEEAYQYSNAVSNYFHELGYRKGDVVVLFMENRPEYVCIWLGLANIGITPALVNFNLRLDALKHCIQVSKAKAVIFGAELTSAIDEVKDGFGGEVQLFSQGQQEGDVPSTTILDQAIHKTSTSPPPRDTTTKFSDPLLFIYTSGTTGMPKAAKISHSRYFFMAKSLHFLLNITSDDYIYCTLPLYHTAGGILGVGQTLISGSTLVVRRKFSASRFWDDCVKYNCTVAQYIGEICRYLLAQPARPQDKLHKVRLAYGNGLRPQIWTSFKNRFNVERIGEFYGATEGNANLVNSDNTVGKVGFVTRILPFVYPVTLIKVDTETGKPLRDSHGMCIKCQPGEPGELVGKIIKGDPVRHFDGYINSDATNKKICYDVFHKGDHAFLTGDLLVMDEYGYMAFKDRTGDTFRWRGENVSTLEVEATISNIVALKDVVVYGVHVPGLEGCAGMAAIADNTDSLDLRQFYTSMQKALPSYARPVFLRILHKVDSTGTFKLKKMAYRSEGFNPETITDPLYYLDTRKGEYRPVNSQVYQDLCNAAIRL